MPRDECPNVVCGRGASVWTQAPTVRKRWNGWKLVPHLLGFFVAFGFSEVTYS